MKDTITKIDEATSVEEIKSILYKIEDELEKEEREELTEYAEDKIKQLETWQDDEIEHQYDEFDDRWHSGEFL